MSIDKMSVEKAYNPFDIAQNINCTMSLQELNSSISEPVFVSREVDFRALEPQLPVQVRQVKSDTFCFRAVGSNVHYCVAPDPVPPFPASGQTSITARDRCFRIIRKACHGFPIRRTPHHCTICRDQQNLTVFDISPGSHDRQNRSVRWLPIPDVTVDRIQAFIMQGFAAVLRNGFPYGSSVPDISRDHRHKPLRYSTVRSFCETEFRWAGSGAIHRFRRGRYERAMPVRPGLRSRRKSNGFRGLGSYCETESCRFAVRVRRERSGCSPRTNSIRNPQQGICPNPLQDQMSEPFCETEFGQ